MVKRKVSELSDEAVVADSSASLRKRPKRKTEGETPPKTADATKKSLKGRVAVKNPTPESTMAHPAEPKRINKIVQAKIDQTVRFLDPKPKIPFSFSPDICNHIIVNESALLAALMCLAQDFEVGDPRRVGLEDVEEAIIDRYVATIGTCNVPVTKIVLDLSKRTTFEYAIQQKIEGHGLENFNLLEIELAMYEAAIEQAMTQNLFRAVEVTQEMEVADNGKAKPVDDDVESDETDDIRPADAASFVPGSVSDESG